MASIRTAGLTKDFGDLHGGICLGRHHATLHGLAHRLLAPMGRATDSDR
jgi:hypothetical protein